MNVSPGQRSLIPQNSIFPRVALSPPQALHLPNTFGERRRLKSRHRCHRQQRNVAIISARSFLGVRRRECRHDSRVREVCISCQLLVPIVVGTPLFRCLPRCQDSPFEKTVITCRNESVFRDIQLPTRRYSPRASNSEKNERRRAAPRRRARRCNSR